MRKLLFVLTALLATAIGRAQDVKVEFITPSIVHIVKGQPTKTLVITAKPEDVAVSKSNNTWKSSELRRECRCVDSFSNISVVAGNKGF